MVARVLLLLLCICLIDGFKMRLNKRPDVNKRIFQISRGNKPFGNPAAVNPIDKMRNIEDSEYTANITFGTPPQTFRLIMDTGSANVWASSSTCKDKGCSNMNKFNTAASSTYNNLHKDFLLIYGTGYCAGNLANDTVGVGSVAIKGQGIGVATVVAAFFEQVPDVDGIFGLGLSAIAEPPTLIAPLTNMLAQGLVTAGRFGVYLDSAADDNSELTWGTVDSTKYTGELQTVKYRPFPTEIMYYMAPWTKMTIEGTKVAGVGCILSCLAVIDTGTSAIVGPTDTINSINKMLQIATDCSNKNTLPDVVIEIEGKQYSIPSKVYVIEQEGQCASGFIGTPEYQGFWIFGDPFLRTVYTVFDNDNKQFQFGLSVGPNQA